MASSNEISITSKIHSIYTSIDHKNYESIRENLAMLIDELINTDFASLVQLLYKIDVDERKLKQHLADDPDSNSAAVVADLIIQRQLEKIAKKNKFSEDNPPHPGDDERW